VRAIPEPAPKLLNQSERPSAVHWKILLLSWLGWLSVFHTLMTFFFLSGLYAEEFGLDDPAVAWIKAVAIGCTGVGGLAFGLFGDRSGRRGAMAASVALCAVGVTGAMVAPHGTWMLWAAAIAGLGIGGQWASGQTLLGETVPPWLRGRFGALAQSGAPLGLALATLAAFEIAPRVGWRSVFAGTLAPALLVPAMMLLLPESDVWSKRREQVRQGNLIDRAKLAELRACAVRSGRSSC
jgi:MFS family permease